MLASIRFAMLACSISRDGISKVPEHMRTIGPTMAGCAAAYASESIAPHECPTNAGAVESERNWTTS